MKGLFVSINSLGELTGGGLYARTLYSEYKNRYEKFDVICKESTAPNNASLAFLNGNIKYLKKNSFTDLLSRLMCAPTFLMAYIIVIFGYARDYDVIHFHSSRNFPIAIMLRIFLFKKVVIHFDNVEYKLSFKLIDLSPVAFLRLYDSILLFIYEVILGRIILKHITFITISDKVDLAYKKAAVIPIKINPSFKSFPDFLIRERSNSEFRVIFVASFAHTPNVNAFYEILFVARMLPNIKFQVVGRDASRLKFDQCEFNNVIIHSDISNSELDELCRNSHVSLNLVKDGGGMKTKIAEAMSFSLPVICSPHSTIGYEQVLCSKLIREVETTEQVKHSIEEFYALYNDLDLSIFHSYWDDFVENFMMK